MKDTFSMTITPEKDVVILLGDKPFPFPLTHLTMETEVIDAESSEDDLSFPFLARPGTLNLYNNGSLIASTHRYDLDPKRRVITLSEKHTAIHQA